MALARALLTEAPTLVLIEPTSALDSHTESRVAQRLHDARRGRATVVVTASPLVLEACDEVLLLDEGGSLLTRSTHRELLARARAGDVDALTYRRIVARASGEECSGPDHDTHGTCATAAAPGRGSAPGRRSAEVGAPAPPAGDPAQVAPVTPAASPVQAAPAATSPAPAASSTQATPAPAQEVG